MKKLLMSFLSLSLLNGAIFSMEDVQQTQLRAEYPFVAEIKELLNNLDYFNEVQRKKCVDAIDNVLNITQINTELFFLPKEHDKKELLDYISQQLINTSQDSERIALYTAELLQLTAEQLVFYYYVVKNTALTSSANKMLLYETSKNLFPHDSVIALFITLVCTQHLLKNLDYFNPTSKEKCLAAVEAVINIPQEDDLAFVIDREIAQKDLYDYMFSFADNSLIINYLKANPKCIAQCTDLKDALKKAFIELTPQQAVFCYYILSKPALDDAALLECLQINNGLFIGSPEIAALMSYLIQQFHHEILQFQNTLSKKSLDIAVDYAVKNLTINNLTLVNLTDSSHYLKERMVYRLLQHYIYSDKGSSILISHQIDSIIKNLSQEEKKRIIQRMTHQNYNYNTYKSEDWLQALKENCLKTLKNKWQSLQACYQELLIANRSRLHNTEKITILKNYIANYSLNDFNVINTQMLASALNISLADLAHKLNVDINRIEKMSVASLAFLDFAVNESLYKYEFTAQDIEEIGQWLPKQDLYTLLFWIKNNKNSLTEKRSLYITHIFESMSQACCDLIKMFKQSDKSTQDAIAQCFTTDDDATTKEPLNTILTLSKKLKKYSIANAYTLISIIDPTNKIDLALSAIKIEDFTLLDAMKKCDISLESREARILMQNFGISRSAKGIFAKYNTSTSFSGADTTMIFVAAGALAYFAYKMPKDLFKVFMR